MSVGQSVAKLFRSSWFAFLPRFLLSQQTLWKVQTAAGIEAYARGKYPDAEMQFRAALKAAEELEPISSRLARIEFDTTRQVRDLFSPRLPTSLNNLAKTLQVQGRYSATESLFKQALAILQSSLPESGRNAIGTVTNLAGLYREQNNYVEAETLLRWALKNSDSELQALCLASVAEIYAGWVFT